MTDYEQGYQDGLKTVDQGDTGGGFFGAERSPEYKQGFLAALSQTRKDVSPR